MNEWISVKEKKPSGYQDVFLRLKHKETGRILYMAGFWDFDHFTLNTTLRSSNVQIPVYFNVLNWMYIPVLNDAVAEIT